MRIAVIGTSNSLMPRGYVSGLRAHPKITCVENFSLGHSTSVAIPYLTKNLNFSNFDFCLFDFVVNEEQWAQTEQERNGIILRLNDLMARMSGSTCLPVFIIMPTMNRVGRLSPVHKLYIDYSKAHGLPYLDGFKFVERILNGSKFTLEQLFRDNSHLAEWIATGLGLALAEAFCTEHRPFGRTTRLSVTGKRMEYVEFATQFSTGTHEVRQRKSSVIQADFLRFESAGTIEYAYQCKRIVGLGLNLSQTNCKFEISSGDESRRFSFGSEYFDPSEKKFVFVIRPTPPLEVFSDEVKISWRSFKSQEPNNVLLEIHGLSFETDDCKMNIIKTDADPNHLELVDYLYDPILKTICLISERDLAYLYKSGI